MNNFEIIKSKSIDEFAEWLNRIARFEDSPWIEWFNDNYCNKCEPETDYICDDIDGVEWLEPYEVNWCELRNQCKHFTESNDVLNIKQIIKMWLELDNNHMIDV